MSFPHLTLNWDLFGGFHLRRAKSEARVAPSRVVEPEAVPSPVSIRLASGSIVRIDFDRSTQRMSFGRIR